MSSATPARIQTTVWGVVVALLTVIAAGAAYQVWDARLRALADRQAQATRFLSGAEAALNRSLLAIDVLLAGTDAFLGLSTTMPEWVDAEAASALLRNAASQNLMVRFVALVDETGRVFASSEPFGASRQRDLPKEFVDEALGQSISTLIVSAPVVSFASSERVLYFGRYVRMADGSKLLAVAEVPTAMLSAVLMQGTDIAALQVTLERVDGQLLLGVPTQDARTNVRLTPALSAAMAVAEGTPLASARLTQSPALVVTRPLLYRDLWLTASIPVEAALGEWRTDRNIVLTAAGALSLLILLAGGFVVVFLNRIATARAAIDQSKTTLDQALESMVSGFVLLDAQHRVVQWNRRFVDLFPWMAGTIAALVPFRAVLEMAARHHLPQADDKERQHWVDERIRAQSSVGLPHQQVLPNGSHIEITERATPDGGMVIT